MLITVSLGLAKPHTIYDRGMIKGIGNDSVLLNEKRFENPAVGVKGGYIKDGIFCSEEFSQLFLQLLVDVLRAADKTHGAHSVTMRIDILVSGLDGPGMR